MSIIILQSDCSSLSHHLSNVRLLRECKLEKSVCFCNKNRFVLKQQILGVLAKTAPNNIFETTAAETAKEEEEEVKKKSISILSRYKEIKKH